MSKPIDPNDKLALRVFSGALECNKWYTDMYGTAYAVARAVLPEGYVAVPVETLVKLSDSVSALKHVTSGVSMRNNVRVITCRIDALIPTEATDE